MKYGRVELVGARRIESQSLVMDYEDNDEYEWSSGERERDLAKAVSRKVGIPAQFLTMEFFRFDGYSFEEEDFEGEWVRNWLHENDLVKIRGLIVPEYGAQLEKSFKVLEEDISRMKTDTETADFVLKTKNGTRKFPVHKTILTCRSKVFRAMFSSNMAEVSTGEAIIEDIEEDTLEELIHFLYTGGLSGSQYNIVSLCNAAEKYELPSLMDLVRFNMMSAELNVNQLADLFIASDMFSQEEMFQIAKEKLTEGMWEKGMRVKDVMEKGMKVNAVLEKIKDRPELTNKILEL